MTKEKKTMSASIFDGLKKILTEDEYLTKTIKATMLAPDYKKEAVNINDHEGGTWIIKINNKPELEFTYINKIGEVTKIESYDENYGYDQTIVPSIICKYLDKLDAQLFDYLWEEDVVLMLDNIKEGYYINDLVKPGAPQINWGGYAGI